MLVVRAYSGCVLRRRRGRATCALRIRLIPKNRCSDPCAPNRHSGSARVRTDRRSPAVAQWTAKPELLCCPAGRMVGTAYSGPEPKWASRLLLLGHSAYGGQVCQNSVAGTIANLWKNNAEATHAQRLRSNLVRRPGHGAGTRPRCCALPAGTAIQRRYAARCRRRRAWRLPQSAGPGDCAAPAGVLGRR
jgi:hypothetical protein